MNRCLYILLFIIAVTVIVCLLCNYNIRGGSSGLVYGGNIKDINELMVKLPNFTNAPDAVSPEDCYKDIMKQIPQGDINDPCPQLGKADGFKLTPDSSDNEKNAFVNYIRGRLYCRANSEQAIRAIKERMREKDQRIADLRNEVERLGQQRDDCDRQLADCRRQRDECHRELAECRRALEELNRKGISSNEELERLRITEKQPLEARIRELEARIRDLEAQIRDLTRQNDDKDRQIAELQRQLEVCNERYAKDMNLIAGETSDYVRFCRQLQNLAAQAAAPQAAKGGFTLSRGGFEKQKDRLNNEIKINAGLSPPERKDLLNTLGGIHYGSRRY